MLTKIQSKAEQFFIAVNEAKINNPLISDMLSDYEISDYENFTVYLNEAQNAGFAIKPDGDLINLFNNSGISGYGKILVNKAIELGAKKLDCFEGFLPDYYRKFGFITYKREKNWSGNPDDNGVQYMVLASKLYDTQLDISISDYTDWCLVPR